MSLFPPVTLCISSFPLQLVPLYPTRFCFYFHDIYAYMLLHIHIKSRSPKIRENIRYFYSGITLNYRIYLQLHPVSENIISLFFMNEENTTRYICYVFLVDSSASQRLSEVHNLAIVSSAAINIYVQVPQGYDSQGGVIWKIYVEVF